MKPVKDTGVPSPIRIVTPQIGRDLIKTLECFCKNMGVRFPIGIVTTLETYEFPLSNLIQRVLVRSGICTLSDSARSLLEEIYPTPIDL